MSLRKYELSFWLKIGSETVVDKINKLFQDLNLEIIKTINLKEGKLAYPIKKETLGLFGTIYFQGEADKVLLLKSKLKNFPEILRFIILRRLKINES
jgi:ribosomal protein S6